MNPRRILPALLLLTPLLATACGGGGSGDPPVADVGSPSASSSASGSPHASALAYSRCMRAHGVSDFPDPDSEGSIGIRAGPGSDLDPHNPTFKAAQQACRSLRPQPSPAQRAQMQAAMLKYAKCMRAHGISDFPDPSNGGLTIRSKSGGDLDPNNPRFKAAQQACRHDLPGGKLGGRLTTGGNGGGR